MKASMRSWSPMRCMISPTILVSKKCKGRRISLARKSEIKAILILVFTCSNIQLRMKSTDSLAIKITNCEYKDQGYETQVVVPYTGIYQALREERQDELQYAGCHPCPARAVPSPICRAIYIGKRIRGYVSCLSPRPPSRRTPAPVPARAPSRYPARPPWC